MQKPHLIIIAGCNGAGKSTYSQSFTDIIVPFDYDKQFLTQPAEVRGDPEETSDKPQDVATGAQ